MNDETQDRTLMDQVRAWLDPVLKIIVVLVMAGILWGRVETRLGRIETHIVDEPKKLDSLGAELTSLKEEVIKLRIEMAETRATLKAKEK